MNIAEKIINNAKRFFGIRNYNTIKIYENFKILEKTKNFDKEDTDWAIQHARFDKFEYKGNGEKVAVLDTGVDINHADLIGQVTAKSFIDGDESFEDLVGHGTFCAGEIVASKNGTGVIGIAPQAKCFCGKILYGNYKDGGINNFEQILANAIRKSIEEGCGVISMSIGFPTYSKIVEDAINEATENGVIALAAMGNYGMYGSRIKLYPAFYKNCIAVAAADARDLPSWFSSYGELENKKPEISISSLEYYWGCLPGNLHGKMTGTSMSTPIASGVALLWRESLRIRNKMPSGSNVLYEFREWLIKNAVDTNNNGWDDRLGWGVLILDDEDL